MMAKVPVYVGCVLFFVRCFSVTLFSATNYPFQRKGKKTGTNVERKDYIYIYIFDRMKGAGGKEITPNFLKAL